MGKRDVRWREPKKSKKGERKGAALATSSAPLPQTEVIRKRKAAKESEQ